MKADLTRSTFAPAKHYRSVRMQQGRVQLDADWNEQQDILDHRIEAETADLLGPLAAPADGAGFQLTASGVTVAIGPGHVYVGGVLCENDAADLTIDKQPDLPAAACVLVSGVAQDLPAPAGLYLGFIHVWQRHLTALEDPAIREIALGGPDTATRVKTLWQVQLLQASTDPAAPLDCLSAIPAWDTLIQSPNGQLAARAEPSPDPSNPCKLSPTAGYRRLDNLLYRVEVHLMPGADPAFKWSHDNGSIESSWLSATPGSSANQLDLGVATIGRDPVLSFGPGQWVELFDDTTELLGQPGTLAKVVKAEGATVTIDVTASQVFPAGAQTDIAKFPANPRLRRWDGWDFVKNATAASVSGGWYELEDGVQVKFKWAALAFRHGDYWTFAARTATQVAGATVEWPVDLGGNPVYQAQEGVPHLWGRLAMLAFSGGAWSVVSDCRPMFPSLTELVALSYVGGDAQTVSDGDSLALPRPLEAGVSMGSLPVGMATVRFTVETGTLPNGTTTQDVTIAPADKGIARIAWTLAPAVPHQYAHAELLEGGAPSATHYLPVHFSASIADDGCACTVCVSQQAQLADKLALQNAIDAVIVKGGGVVCLDVGDYTLGAALQVNHAIDIVLRGKGSKTRILGPGALLLIDGSTDVRVEALTLDSSGVGEASFATLGVQDTNGFALVDAQVIVEGTSTQATAILATGKLAEVRLQHCEVIALIGMVGGAMPGADAAAVTIDGLDVEDCRFVCASAGITLQMDVSTRPLRFHGCRFEASQVWALAVSASSKNVTPIEVTGNSVQSGGLGLVVVATSVRMAGNDLTYDNAGTGQFAILLQPPVGSADDFQVLDNRISGFPTGIGITPATRTRVAGNHIVGGEQGISVVDASGVLVTNVVVEANQVSDLEAVPPSVISTNVPPPAVTGIQVLGASAAIIRGNVLRRIGLATTAAAGTIYGVIGYGCDRVQLNDNDILDLAPPGAFAGVGIGVGAFLPYTDLDMSGNRVRRSATTTIGDASTWGGLYAGPAMATTQGAALPVKSARAAKAKTSKKVRASVAATVRFPAIFQVPTSLIKPTVKTVVVPGLSAGPPATVRPTAQPDAVWVVARGNQVLGLGLGACAALSGTSVTFVGNKCQRFTGTLTTTQQLAAPVILVGYALTASNNVVDGAEDRQIGGPIFTSILLTTFEDGHVTVLGNHTSGSIMEGTSALGTPWSPLNVLL